MNPRPPSVTEQRRQLTMAQLKDVTSRLEVAELRLVQIQNTLKAVARESGFSVAGPCSRCDESYLIVTEGTIRCTHCGYHRRL